MSLREFGNAFKQAVAEKLADGILSKERAERIYPRNQKDNKVVGSEDILKPVCVYPNNCSHTDGSVVIDSW